MCTVFIPNWLISDLYHILHHHHHSHMPSSASHGTLRPCSTFVGGGPTPNSSTDVLTLSASTLSKPILRSSADNLLQNQNQQSMVSGWSHLQIYWICGKLTEFHESQCFKIFQLSHLNFLAFSIYFCPINSDQSGNTVWPQTWGFHKLAKIDNFWYF